MTMRAEDWPERLNTVIERECTRRFRYGRFDCAIFAARVVDAMTGSEHEAAIRANYSNTRGAYHWIDAAGGLDRIVTERLGRDAIDTRLAGRGDIVFYPGVDELGTLGVCVGDRCLVPMRPRGLRAFALADASKAWRVD